MEYRKLYHQILVLIIVAIPLLSVSGQPTPEALESKIDQYVQPYLDMDAWSGVISVYERGEPVFQKAYGYANREWHVRNTIDTKFRIASISKLFTEVAILKLVEDNKIDLDQTLSTFIPDYPRGNEITVGHLLKHRAGIPHLNDFPNYKELMKFDHDLNEIIGLFKDKPLDFAPGERYRYSNSGYVLLAFIIEKVSGLEYGMYLQKEIFDRLSLSNTGVDDSRKILENRAYGYMFNRSGSLVNADYVNMSIKIGGGSLYSTAGDLNVFLQHILNRKIIKTTLDELPNFDEADGEKVFVASGRVQGFCHQITHRLGPDLTVMVLGNHYSNLALPISDDIYAIYADLPYDIPENYLKQSIELPIEALQGYEGNYDFGFGPVRKLRIKGRSLTYGDVNSESSDDVIPIGNNRFFYIQYWVILEFKNWDGDNYNTLEWIMGKNRYPAERVNN